MQNGRISSQPRVFRHANSNARSASMMRRRPTCLMAGAMRPLLLILKAVCLQQPKRSDRPLGHRHTWDGSAQGVPDLPGALLLWVLQGKLHKNSGIWTFSLSSISLLTVQWPHSSWYDFNRIVKCLLWEFQIISGFRRWNDVWNVRFRCLKSSLAAW